MRAGFLHFGPEFAEYGPPRNTSVSGDMRHFELRKCKSVPCDEFGQPTRLPLASLHAICECDGWLITILGKSWFRRTSPLRRINAETRTDIQKAIVHLRLFGGEIMPFAHRIRKKENGSQVWTNGSTNALGSVGRDELDRSDTPEWPRFVIENASQAGKYPRRKPTVIRPQDSQVNAAELEDRRCCLFGTA
jgi:hypothetical protein